MKYATLPNWLYVVASLRLFSVVLGYFFPFRLRQNLFVKAPQFPDLTARTFAVWTTMTCMVCVLTAQNPTNLAMLQLCCGSFVVALSFFALELFVYRTVSVASAASPFVIACECCEGS
jgi:hypothetical protein